MLATQAKSKQKSVDYANSAHLGKIISRLRKHILFNLLPTFEANHIKVFSVQKTQRNTVRNVQSAPCVENLITKF